MEIVVPVRKGGLGNQLFEVAAAIVYNLKLGNQVVLPKELPHSHHRHFYSYEESVFQGFPSLNVELNDSAIESLLRQGFTRVTQNSAFEPWGVKPLKGNIILDGYFQYYPALEPHAEDIVRYFLKGLNLYGIAGHWNHIAIHVRRGDYLKFKDVYPNLDVSYYARAIQEIEKRFPGPKTYKIFSDDIPWCREQDVFQSLESVVFVEEIDEIKSLKEMIQCQGGCICANSTFSWWGAFLGAHQQGRPCIVPEDWIHKEKPTVFPKSWIQIQSIQGKLRFFEPGTLNFHEKKDVDNIVRPVKGEVEIYVDSFSYSSSENTKVFFQMEPLAIKNVEDFIIQNASLYDYIFTFNQTILEKCPNSKKLHFPACSWISGQHYHTIDISKKKFGISSITGSKQLTEGHTSRLLMYFNQEQLRSVISAEMTFFRSSAGQLLPEIRENPMIQKDKFPLFETYQYSLVIENSRQQNYFTEKLIDCLITKTIPIYYGCPNISEYFDTSGWILLTESDPAKRIEEFVEKWTQANYTRDSYQSFSKTIETNYQTCVKNYNGFYAGMNRALLALPEFQ